MRYQHPDLDQITVFLKGVYILHRGLGNVLTGPDFGMQIVKQTDDQIWYRGYGPDPYVYYARRGPKQFLGATFEVESYQDLEK